MGGLVRGVGIWSGGRCLVSGVGFWSERGCLVMGMSVCSEGEWNALLFFCGFLNLF